MPQIMLSLNGIKMAPTKKILCLSLFDLLEATPLDSIPTKRIYESVGISANSFYYHFRDKYDCASFLFRILLMQAMGGKFSTPDCFFSDIGDKRLIQKEMLSIRESAPEDAGLPYSRWMEKWSPLWYSMALYVRKNARTQFLNIYASREANSPYYEMRASWDRYFEHIQGEIQFKNEKHREFLKEALFSFFELYLFHFALNPDYDFQESDAKLLMRIRQSLYETCLDYID